MKNRKVTLSIFTLRSGAKLNLQITGAKTGFIGWTNFIDVDNSEKEYDNPVWTKDEFSNNQLAVEAIDKLIDIEEDFAAGKIDRALAEAKFKQEYEKWFKAHKAKHPDFYERSILGLTF